MKRNTLLLSPAPGDTGGTSATPTAAAAKPALAAPRHIGISEADLLQELEAQPDAFDTDPAQKVETKAEGQPTETPEQKTAREAKEAADKAKASGEAGAAKGEQGNTATLTADQTAWLELRAAAKTPEEAAEIDKQAPDFTDSQWALVETPAQTAEATPPTPTAEAQAALTAAQTEVATVKAEAADLSKRLLAAETELQAARTKPVAIAAMNPLLTLPPEKLAEAESNAVALKEWALQHWDGTPAEGDQPAYTAEQVRGAYARADKQLTSVIPAAKQYRQLYDRESQVAQQIYPELFTKDSPHAQVRESLLRQMPGLPVALPQINTVIGDATLGESIRRLIFTEQPTADAKALAAALVKADPTLAKFMPQLVSKPTAAAAGAAGKSFRLPAKPIVALARPGSGGGSRLQRPGKGGTPNVSKFLKEKTANGGNELEALAESLKDVEVR